MTRKQVRGAIAEAFGQAPYPGDDRIAGLTGNCPSEYSYVAEYFRGKHWRDALARDEEV